MPHSTPAWLARLRQRRTLPKLSGADLEFANFYTGVDAAGGTSFEASRALLREINGLLSSRPAAAANSASSDRTVASKVEDLVVEGLSQDWGRKFLTNGSCFYIDLNHLEGCLPETLAARDHLAATHALYRIAHRARLAAQARLPEGQRLHLLATNSDGQGNSFGSHLDFLIARAAWEDLFHRKLHYQGFLAAYQASSILFTGLGKVGSENRAPRARFQLSQRADFLEVLTGLQTTHRRPILNTRDEPLCGLWRRGERAHPATLYMARLHVISYDHNLCHTAAFLKVGVLQIILAMIESGRVSPNLLLDDPVDAVHDWSHDPTLEARAPLLRGDPVTALELQRRFLDEARAFVESGGCDEIVPDAGEILARWTATLDHLEARRFEPLARQLDWVLKLTLLEQVLGQHRGLDWTSPELKHLDHLYSSLDPDEGLYWACERNGLVDRLVTDEEIDRFVHHPPENTRAWTRAALLQLADPATIDRIDWDLLRFQYNGHPVYATLDLPDPLDHTRANAQSRLAGANDLWDALVALDAKLSLETPGHSNPSSSLARRPEPEPESESESESESTEPQSTPCPTWNPNNEPTTPDPSRSRPVAEVAPPTLADN